MTGDLARYVADGNIEFLGRLDQQVKLRGFRIEPGEIEVALKSHPDIRDAVVIACEDGRRDKFLAAYVVTAGDPVQGGDLSAFLKQRLAQYMVPSGFVFMDALPLMANGKVNRKAIPEPDQGKPDRESEFIAPSNATEELLAGIQAKVLQLDHVGIYDNFVELGGHSLLATRIITRANTAPGAEIPIKALLEFPNVAELSAAITGSLEKKVADTDLEQILNEIEAMSDTEIREWLTGENDPDNSA